VTNPTRFWAHGRSRPAVIAHRGGAALATENSLVALHSAARAGADAVELDVQELGDGTLILAHDAFLATEGRWRWLRDVSYAEFEAAVSASTATVVTVETLLANAVDSSLGLYLELKAVSHRGVTSVIDLLARHDVTDRTVVGSFRADIVEHVSRDGRVVASILFRERFLDPLALARDLGCPLVHPCFDDAPGMADLMRGEWMARLGAAGVGVVAWNTNDVELLRTLTDLGVRALCTDDPRLVAQPR
jgi:glycerophosphoryl diester phosphodiesterase